MSVHKGHAFSGAAAKENERKQRRKQRAALSHCQPAKNKERFPRMFKKAKKPSKKFWCVGPETPTLADIFPATE